MAKVEKNVLTFSPEDLTTPAQFIETLQLLGKAQKAAGPHGHVDCAKFIDTVTNRDRFDEDAWFDLVFDVGQKNDLTVFIRDVAELSPDAVGRNKILCMPDIVTNAANNTPHVKQIMDKVFGEVEQTAKAKPVEHTVSTSFGSMSP